MNNSDAALSSGQEGEESHKTRSESSPDKLQNTTVFQEQPTQLSLSHQRNLEKCDNLKFNIISCQSSSLSDLPSSFEMREILRRRCQGE